MPLTWDMSTVRLNQGDLALVQSLGDPHTHPACLVLYSGAEPGLRHALPEGQLTVGRAPDCDLTLDSPGVSRRHAELQVAADTVRVRDLGSVNGTHVNGLRIEGSIVLKSADMLRLGDTLLKFYARHSMDALLHDRFYRLATVDAGTGVYSRRYVLDALTREIKRARRHSRPLAVICLDLDHFKSVNDRWGHDAGDQVLRETTITAHACLRGNDLLGRIGGEEFLVVLPDTTLQDALTLAERLRSTLAARTLSLLQADGTEVAHRQTASQGIAVLTPKLASARELVAAADAKLYEAKRAGRNGVAH